MKTDTDTDSDPSPRGTVLVTGGSRGIGAATALRCAKDGFAVAINYTRASAAADTLVQRIRADGGQALALQADVSDEAQVLAMFARIDAELPPLAGLVNNAGIVDVSARVDAIDMARLQRIFAINVFGSFLCAREALRRMSTRHGGRGGAIVNLSSMAATLGSPGVYVDYAIWLAGYGLTPPGIDRIKEHLSTAQRRELEIGLRKARKLTGKAK